MAIFESLVVSLGTTAFSVIGKIVSDKVSTKKASSVKQQVKEEVRQVKEEMKGCLHDFVSEAEQAVKSTLGSLFMTLAADLGLSFKKLLDGLVGSVFGSLRRASSPA